MNIPENDNTFFGERLMAFGRENRDDRLIEAMQTMFADQNRQLNAQGQHLAQQTQRIDGVSNQIAALANQQEALRNDFNQRWSDLPKLYVPRQEHHAMALDSRTTALEEFRVAATKDIADVKISMQNQIQTAINVSAKEIADAKLASQTQIASQRTDLDKRQIALLVGSISSVVAIVAEIIIRVFFH